MNNTNSKTVEYALVAVIVILTAFALYTRALPLLRDKMEQITKQSITRGL